MASEVGGSSDSGATRLETIPWPDSAADWLLATGHLIGYDAAEHTIVVGIAALIAGAVTALLQRHRCPAVAAAAIGYLFATGWTFHAGFYNFQLGVGLATFFLAATPGDGKIPLKWALCLLVI